MTTITYLLSKDPVLERGGDVNMSCFVMGLAAEAFDVSAICLSAETGSVIADVVPNGLPLTRVAKGQVRPAALLAGSVRRRRSLVHVRFDKDALVDSIEQCNADKFVAEHSYMAESFLRSSRFGDAKLIVNTHVSDGLVWRTTRGLLGRIEGPRILRDELRVAVAADAVGTYDAEEAEYYRNHGVPNVRWVELSLPPDTQIDVAANPPRLVCLGMREWAPNQEAFLEALRLWPRIADGISDAELCIVGSKKRGAKDPAYPAGVRDLGFVADLDGFLATCRGLIAPIKTGGGQRPQILELVSRGLPVVATTPAVGSLGTAFDLSCFDDDDAFVAECRRYLLDHDAAARDGDRLYDTNRQYWIAERPHRAVEELLGRC
jgi:glycosyltransferase involved in cell wall biosynthesis